MTNPNNAVGTNGAFGGRTSVNAFNDDLASYTAGILSGWACEPDSGLTVALGGDGNTRDVAIAEDNAGNKTTINNISGSPISVTVGSAPSTNSRIDSIVAYVDNPPTGSATVTDNYGACGLIIVAGTASATPTAPNESAIRTAITADGASGTTAYYVVLANVTVASGTTDLTSDNIKLGNSAKISINNMDFTEFTGYHEIGRLELTSNRAPNDTITLSESTKCIKIVAFGSPVANNAVCQLYLNGDTGNNYARRIMSRSGVDSTTSWFEDNTSNNLANFGSQPANAPCYVEIEICKTAGGSV